MVCREQLTITRIIRGKRQTDNLPYFCQLEKDHGGPHEVNGYTWLVSDNQSRANVMLDRLACLFGYHNPNLKTKICAVCHRPVDFGHKIVCPKCGTWTATRFSKAAIWCYRCDTTYNVVASSSDNKKQGERQ